MFLKGNVTNLKFAFTALLCNSHRAKSKNVKSDADVSDKQEFTPNCITPNANKILSQSKNNIGGLICYLEIPNVNILVHLKSVLKKTKTNCTVIAV